MKPKCAKLFSRLFLASILYLMLFPIRMQRHGTVHDRDPASCSQVFDAGGMSSSFGSMRTRSFKSLANMCTTFTLLPVQTSQLHNFTFHTILFKLPTSQTFSHDLQTSGVSKRYISICKQPKRCLTCVMGQQLITRLQSIYCLLFRNSEACSLPPTKVKLRPKTGSKGDERVGVNH